MCEPATIAMATFALSAAGTGASFYAQSEAAEAQSKFDNQRATETANAANAAYGQNSIQESIRISQESEATGQRLFDERRAARREAARARVSAAESGVSGISVDALQGQLQFQEAGAAQTLNRNFQNTLTDSGFRRESFRADAVNRIASSRPAPTSGPSALAAGLQIGGGALGAYTTYRSEKRLDKMAQFKP